MLAAVTDPNVWRFRPHPEVWLLVAFLIGAYIYAVQVIGPRLVRPGQPVVRGQQVGVLRGRHRACCGRRRTGRSTTSGRTTSTPSTCCST